MTTPIQPGRYRHYKGKDYLVLGVARHSETEEELRELVESNESAEDEAEASG